MTRTIDDLPGPSRLPLLGNLHQVRQATLHATAEEWCERYGPIFRVGLGPRPVVVIDDLDEINRILRERPDGFRRWREIQTIFAEMGIAGVFSEEGEGWRRGRRLTVTALNSNHLQRYFHVITTATERLYRRLTLAAREGRSIDITGELTSLTVDVTSALAFGHDLNTLEGRRGRAAASHSTGLRDARQTARHTPPALALSAATRRPRARSVLGGSARGGPRLHRAGPAANARPARAV